jgi:hypothetical protein
LLAGLLVACGEDESPAAGPDDGGADGAGASDSPSTKGAEAGVWGGIIEVDCPAGTTVEFEGNNTAAKANALDELSFCGAVSPGDDVDYSKFSTPSGKKLALFQGVIEGAVDFDLIVNGNTLRPGEVSKFEAGDYVVKAYTKDKKPGKYRYRIQFEP